MFPRHHVHLSLTICRALSLRNGQIWRSLPSELTYTSKILGDTDLRYLPTTMAMMNSLTFLHNDFQIYRLMEKGDRQAAASLIETASRILHIVSDLSILRVKARKFLFNDSSFVVCIRVQAFAIIADCPTGHDLWSAERSRPGHCRAEHRSSWPAYSPSPARHVAFIPDTHPLGLCLRAAAPVRLFRGKLRGLPPSPRHCLEHTERSSRRTLQLYSCTCRVRWWRCNRRTGCPASGRTRRIRSVELGAMHRLDRDRGGLELLLSAGELSAFHDGVLSSLHEVNRCRGPSRLPGPCCACVLSTRLCNPLLARQVELSRASFAYCRKQPARRNASGMLSGYRKCVATFGCRESGALAAGML